jgi:phosphoenolpyruvate carboxykinase (ATP)
MHHVDCWLVNTGWTGGSYGVGRRMPIAVTRTLLTAALDGSLKNSDFRTDANFGFQVPTHADNIDPVLLTPKQTWRNPVDFERTAHRLVEMFRKNFAAFESLVDEGVRAAGPSSVNATKHPVAASSAI